MHQIKKLAVVFCALGAGVVHAAALKQSITLTPPAPAPKVVTLKEVVTKVVQTVVTKAKDKDDDKPKVTLASLVSAIKDLPKLPLLPIGYKPIKDDVPGNGNGNGHGNGHGNGGHDDDDDDHGNGHGNGHGDHDGPPPYGCGPGGGHGCGCHASKH